MPCGVCLQMMTHDAIRQELQTLPTVAHVEHAVVFLLSVIKVWLLSHSVTSQSLLDVLLASIT